MVGIEEYLQPDPRLAGLIERIRSVRAPGNFCASGREFVPMPRVRVGAVGTLSLPVPEAQVRALIAEAERAPYGRGVETLVDPAVRNSFQIGADRVEISSPRWKEVFGEVLDRTTKALGCAEGSLSAELYKLLVYEPGGFFLPHRDTEKAPGMVATLVIALPTAGAGGELVVRHQGREEVFAMQTDHPSELHHAAFYADCEHEIRPVTTGGRVALVYNLMRRGDGAVGGPPDPEALVASLAAELRRQFARTDGPEKLIWVLEHNYSEAGLSFETLKNADASVGRMLGKAAVRADCSIHAALLEGTQIDLVMSYVESDELPDPRESDFEVAETDDWGFRLSSLRRPGATALAPGELSVNAGELMPEDAIDPEEPDSRTLFEATGNGGASVELLYHRAALVLWPRQDSMRVLAGSGVSAMEAFLAGEMRAGADPDAVSQLVESAAREWPKPPWSSSDRETWWAATERLLDRIGGGGDRELLEKFLDRTVVPHYRAPMNDGLLALARRCGPRPIAASLERLVRARATDSAPAVIRLLHALALESSGGTTGSWTATLQGLTRDLAGGLAGQRKEDGERRRRQSLGSGDLAALCELGFRFGLEDRIVEAIERLLEKRALPSPERRISAAIARLWKESPERCGQSPAFRVLWVWAARFLLARSPRPPDPPADWVTPSKGIGCRWRCPLCRELLAFCADPGARERRWTRKQSDRTHLEEQLRDNADFRRRTLKQGRPYTLIVTKTRARHRKRLAEYGNDVRDLRVLLAAAPGVADRDGLASEIAAAVERADRAESG